LEDYREKGVGVYEIQKTKETDFAHSLFHALVLLVAFPSSILVLFFPGIVCAGLTLGLSSALATLGLCLNGREGTTATGTARLFRYSELFTKLGREGNFNHNQIFLLIQSQGGDQEIPSFGDRHTSGAVETVVETVTDCRVCNHYYKVLGYATHFQLPSMRHNE